MPPVVKLTAAASALRKGPTGLASRLLVALLLIMPAAGTYGRQGGPPHTAGEPQRLTPGAAAARELSRGQTHLYLVTLAEGQFARVAAEQRGVNAVVSLFDPNGRKIVEASPPEDDRVDTLAWVARAPGDYRLRVEVTPFPTAEERGTYELKLTELRAATPAERKEHALKAADAAVSAGSFLFEQATADSLRAALERYKEASDIDKEYRPCMDSYTACPRARERKRRKSRGR